MEEYISHVMEFNEKTSDYIFNESKDVIFDIYENSNDNILEEASEYLQDKIALC